MVSRLTACSSITSACRTSVMHMPLSAVAHKNGPTLQSKCSDMFGCAVFSGLADWRLLDELCHIVTSSLALQWIARSSLECRVMLFKSRRCSTQRHTKLTTRVVSTRPSWIVILHSDIQCYRLVDSCADGHSIVWW